MNREESLYGVSNPSLAFERSINSSGSHGQTVSRRVPPDFPPNNNNSSKPIFRGFM